MKKYTYIFDTQTGHYIKKLNEEDTTISNDVTTDNNANNDKKEDKPQELNNDSKYVSVESVPEYKKLILSLDNENKTHEQTLSNLNAKLATAKQSAETKSSATGDFDHIATDSTVLSILKQILDLNKKHSDNIYRIESQKLALLQQLSTQQQLAKETSERIYHKYKNLLNESNIHTAKVYVNNLVGNEDHKIIKGMNDFKRCLKDSNLLYGKDPLGFFIICVDQEDFDNMYDSLLEVGYLRDLIIDTVMPQLFNRQAMIQ